MDGRAFEPLERLFGCLFFAVSGLLVAVFVLAALCVYLWLAK